MSDNTFGQSIQLLLTRRFGTFWFASFLSNIGTWAQQVAQPWLLLSLGASPFLLGLDAFAMGAPVLLLTLVGGFLADRYDRRTIILDFQSFQMLCPILVVVLLMQGSLHPWMVVVLSLVIGVTDALSMPSFQSIVPSIVEHDQIPAGIALNSTQFNLSRIMGPALAGVLMASIGATGAYAVNAASYVPFILVALWILPRGRPEQTNNEALNFPLLFAGVREVLGEPFLRGALLTVFFTSALCAPLITFCPLLIRDVFRAGVGHFSLTIGAFGVGGLVGATGLLGVAPDRDRRPLISWLAVVFSGVVVLSALNRWPLGLPVLFILAGMSMTASNASANALLQGNAPPGIRGQTVSLFMLVMRGGLSLGSLLTGVSVGVFGVREALLINGMVAIVIHLALGRTWGREALPRSVI